ncbi:hypothetical protein PQR02_31490 [Paraburkholderia sediminicola]|uniref:Uncharacterized protein n=1 Tax=Paraburkholderia rhynchosiae TaxID=487049 RepID=A0ACC7NKX6_9BURK
MKRWNGPAEPERRSGRQQHRAPIITVAIEPGTTSNRLAVNAPITERFDTSSRITTINGTATTPLTTALQNSAFIGLIDENRIASAASTLTAMMP